MIAERGSVRFSELFESAASRAEVVCTFLALLELIRLKQLVCIAARSRLRKLKSSRARTTLSSPLTNCHASELTRQTAAAAPEPTPPN